MEEAKKLTLYGTNMKVLLDTNIILDYLLKREPHYTNARQVFEACLYQINGFVTPHALVDIFYVLSERTTSSDEYCRNTILKLSTVLSVIPEDLQIVTSAIKNEKFDDFENSIQHECAKNFIFHTILQNTFLKIVTH